MLAMVREMCVYIRQHATPHDMWRCIGGNIISGMASKSITGIVPTWPKKHYHVCQLYNDLLRDSGLTVRIEVRSIQAASAVTSSHNKQWF